MDATFWRERWSQGQTGFHRGEVNPQLIQHWGALEAAPDAPVFVPLCGKTLDLGWLRSQGHPVRGVEVSDMAVEQLFAESGIACTTKRDGAFDVSEGGGIRIYSPQKGASPAVVGRLEAGARHFARIAKRDLGVAVSRIPGAGAAGGFGAGLIAFLDAELRPGIELVLDAVRFEERARGADLIVTGEGRIDRQTQYGKAPAGVAAAAQKLGIPCIALCGSVGPGAGVLHARGLTAMHSIVDEPLPLDEALRRAPTLLKRAAERLARTWAAGAKSQQLAK